MRITVLVDNTSNTRNLKAEAGLSIYLEDRATKILFDTGESSLFLENAAQLGFNLLDNTYVVLSHGHHDHSWGLNHLLPLYTQAGKTAPNLPTLLAHPLAFNRRVKENQELGLNIPEEILANFFILQKSRVPVWITEQLVFLGEINRQFDFEGTNTIGQIIKNNIAEADLMQDDTALA